jgi:hypothetical protein
MATLVEESIIVVNPPRLDGCVCLVAARYATFQAGGLTDMGGLLQIAKNVNGSEDSRLRAAEEIWRVVGNATRCLPDTHPARSAVGVVHVPFSESNRFAVNAVACGVAEVLGIEIHSETLTKRVHGPKMKGAPPAVKAQIQGAFDAHDVPKGPLVVVDDLVESGATLAAARHALRAAGAGKLVYIAGLWLDR